MATQPKAQVEVTATNAKLGAKLAAIGVQFKKAGKQWREALFGKLDKNEESKGGLAGAGGAFLGNIAAQAVGAGVSFVKKQRDEVVEFNDQMTRMRILSGSSVASMKVFEGNIRKASDATGTNQLEVLAASRAYITLTGDMATAQSQVGNFAKVAVATESSAEDIARTAAAMKQNLNIDPGQMMDAFGILNQQGKAGAIELKDLSQQLANIAPQWAMFKDGTGLQGLKQMGAALQIAKRGFGGDASETVTGIQGLLTALIKHSGRFKKAGVRVFDIDKNGQKTMRNVFDIIDDISNSKLVKDPRKLNDAFGCVEAYRAFIQLRNNNSELKEMVRLAGSAQDLEKDFATYMASDGGKAKKEWQQIVNGIKDAFSPERLQVFLAAAQGIAKALGGVVTVMGGILGAAQGIAKEAAKFFGGETEDDKVARIHDERRKEREQKLSERYLELFPEENKWLGGRRMHDPTPMLMSKSVPFQKRDEWVNKAFLEEENLKADLADQIQGKTIARPLMQGSGDKRKFVRDLGNYSVSELQDLKRRTNNKSTDPGMFAQLIDAAIARQTQSFGAAVRAGMQEAMVKGLVIKLSPDDIAKAQAEAPKRKRRPGG
jgi:hypothetical protein